MRLQALDLVVATLVLVVLLAGQDRFRRSAMAMLRPMGVRLLAALAPPPEVDEVAEELYRALRHQRLQADVRRLERILASDMSMSATRQIGNRLAYGWLVRELDLSTGGAPPWPAPPTTSLEVVTAGSLDPSAAAPGRRHNPKVETLTIGWR